MSSSLDEILSSDNSEYYESNEEMSEKSSSESEGESALFQNKDKTNRKHNSTKSKQPLNSTMRNESTLLKNLKKHRLQLQAMKKNQNKIQPKYANQTKTNEVEETPHIVNIPCKNLMKGPNLKSFHYNITVPKNAKNLVVCLKRSNMKEITINAQFDRAKVIHNSPDSFITAS